MSNKKKAAFIQCGEFSHTNERILKTLQANFPDFQFDVYDIYADFLLRKDILMLLHSFRLYWNDLLTGKKTFVSSYVKTPYAFRKIRKALIAKLQNKGYTFTFQSQSLFDSSIPGIPHFVYSDHTHLANLQYPGYMKGSLLHSSWIDCEKTIYQNAAMNFTWSSNIFRSIIHDYDCSPEKVECVYCGANIQVNDNELLDENRFSKKKILFVGIDWKRKGGPTLVEAFKKVLAVHPEATLTIVGCNPDIDVPNCTVKGRMPLSKVKEYFSHASLFCLPTTVEPFGIVFLEAMAYKLPIIGSNIGAIPDFIHVDKNGFLVEPDNVEILAEKIIALLDDPDKCKAFGEFGNSIFHERYTWEKTGERIRKKINQVLEKQSGRV